MTLVHWDKKKKRERTRKYKKTLGAVFSELIVTLDAIRAQRDRDAFRSLERTNKDYGIHLAPIDVSEHDWLNFMASQEEIEDLRRRGQKAADNFLKKNPNILHRFPN